MHLEHVGIYAADTESLSKWYCEVLGMEVVRRLDREGRPPIFFLRAPNGGTQIEILPSQDTRVERKLGTPGYSHLGIVVDDFERTAEALASRGVELWGCRTTSAGWKIGYFTDPEGNVLEIIQR